MQVGDLVFVHGRPVGKYRLTKPGSWGYVRSINESAGHVVVYTLHYGEGSKGEKPARWTVAPKDLRVLPNPPETHDEITELVRLLTKLTA